MLFDDQKTHTAGKRGCHSQGGGNEADEISDDTTSEGKDNSIASAGINKKEILDFGFAFSGFYRLSRSDGVGEEP